MKKKKGILTKASFNGFKAHHRGGKYKYHTASDLEIGSSHPYINVPNTPWEIELGPFKPKAKPKPRTRR
jgi:hypothetical protein